nr:chemotaxis protein CheC [uncultured Rhodoferax sp.]
MKLNALELDALTEIFNHGVGQAALALSELAGEQVMLSVPKVEELSKRAITDTLDAQGAHRVCAVRQGFTGAVNTEALLMFPVDQSLRLVQLMVGDDFPLAQLSEMEQESLAEIGNILLNSVVSSVADMLHIEFEGSLPHVELGQVADVLHGGSGLDDLILSLQINFEIATRQIQGYLVFLLDVASSDVLKKKITAFIESLS